MPGARLLYCANGYHGKTLGALSVTGRDKHRAPFEPLLPRCDSIPFGDADALETALRQGDVGAFILEPIQGEGGVLLPPPGYLARVRELCTEYACILILDEIQTGLGRTGKLFACEWEGVEPDILVIAKSLSGGAVPIGATLSRSDLWDRAYGDSDSFALHTSTFGGGNLAAATALATLDVIAAEDLSGNAARVGTQLKDALSETVSAYPFIREVRGRGLMIAIEFANSFSGGVEAFVREFASRMPGNAAGTYRMLSGKAKEHIREAIEEVEKNFEEMFVLRFVTKLAQEHGILTFLTANNNRVMRIQPPLLLSEAEAQRFVEAFSRVCKDMSTFLD
jgi:acetylornithine/succinyldiaminopimelate/putrescine aminotransferase